MEPLSNGDGSSNFVCGFCPYSSTDYKILVKHLQEHSSTSGQRHMHSLWCPLCAPKIFEESQKNEQTDCIEQPQNTYPQYIADCSGLGFHYRGVFYPTPVLNPLNCYPVVSAGGLSYGYLNTESAFDPQNYSYNSGYYNGNFYDGSYSFPAPDKSGSVYPTGNCSNAYDQLGEVISYTVEEPAGELVLYSESLAGASEDKTVSLKASNSDFSKRVKRKTKKIPRDDSDQNKENLELVMKNGAKMVLPLYNGEGPSNTKMPELIVDLKGTIKLRVDDGLPNSPIKFPAECISENPRFAHSAGNSPVECISENFVFPFSVENSPAECISESSSRAPSVRNSPVKYISNNSSFASSAGNSPETCIPDVKTCSETINSETQMENALNFDRSFVLDVKSRPETPEIENICLETKFEHSQKTLNETSVENISNEDPSFTSNVEKSPSRTDVDTIGIECINVETTPMNSKEELEISNVKNSSLVLPSEVEPVSNLVHSRSDLDNTICIEHSPDTENRQESNEPNVGHFQKDVTNRTRRSFNGKLKQTFVNGNVSQKGNVNSNKRLPNLSCNITKGTNTRKNCTDQTSSSTSYRNSNFPKNCPNNETEYASTSYCSPASKDHGKLSYSEVVKFGKPSTVRGS